MGGTLKSARAAAHSPLCFWIYQQPWYIWPQQPSIHTLERGHLRMSSFLVQILPFWAFIWASHWSPPLWEPLLFVSYTTLGSIIHSGISFHCWWDTIICYLLVLCLIFGFCFLPCLHVHICTSLTQLEHKVVFLDHLCHTCSPNNDLGLSVCIDSVFISKTQTANPFLHRLFLKRLVVSLHRHITDQIQACVQSCAYKLTCVCCICGLCYLSSWAPWNSELETNRSCNFSMNWCS